MNGGASALSPIPCWFDPILWLSGLLSGEPNPGMLPLCGDPNLGTPPCLSEVPDRDTAGFVSFLGLPRPGRARVMKKKSILQTKMFVKILLK